MSKHPAWTQLVHVHWSHSLTFYERRIELIRAIHEHDERLGHYKISDSSISVRSADWDYRVEVDPVSVTVYVNSQEPDATLCDHLVELAFEHAGEEDVGSVAVALQHLLPLEGTAAGLQATAAQRVLGRDVARVQFKDFSASADARVDGLPYSANILYGVLSQDETPTALSRSYGTMSEGPDPELVAMWSGRDLPPAAFYLGTRWYTRQVAEGARPAPRVRHHWDEALGLADELATELAAYALPGEIAAHDV